MFLPLASSFQGYSSVKQGKCKAAILAYAPETATEFTIFTFHNGNFIQIVNGATGMQITSQADKMSFLSLYLFPPHIWLLWEGNMGAQARRDPQSTLTGVLT